MAEIKFKKTTDLPSSPTSADDGVYFVRDKDGVFSKIAVISGGVIKEYTSEGGGTNLTAGEGLEIDDGVPEIYLLGANENDLGGVRIRKMLQEDYDALPVKDPYTLYYILDKTPDLIFTVEIISAITLSTSGSFSPNLSPAIFPSIWDKTYDWDIVWRDANGLHNLRDYSDFIERITGVTYSGGAINIAWIKTSQVLESLTIPAGAKLVLRLSDNAPTYST